MIQVKTKDKSVIVLSDRLLDRVNNQIGFLTAYNENNENFFYADRSSDLQYLDKNIRDYFISSFKNIYDDLSNNNIPYLLFIDPYDEYPEVPIYDDLYEYIRFISDVANEDLSIFLDSMYNMNIGSNDLELIELISDNEYSLLEIEIQDSDINNSNTNTVYISALETFEDYIYLLTLENRYPDLNDLYLIGENQAYEIIDYYSRNKLYNPQKEILKDILKLEYI